MWERETTIGMRMGEVEVGGRGIKNILGGVGSLLCLLVRGGPSLVELSS